MDDDIKAVIRAPIDEVTDSDLYRHDDGPAPEATYFFPSFPKPPPRISVKSFDQWIPQGVYLSQNSKVSCIDFRGLKFASDRQPQVQDSSTVEERLKEKKLRQLQKGKLGVRVTKEDCFKLGDEGTSWIEPEDTSKSNYDTSIPPFTRLLSASRDFLNSRNEEFQFNRTKSLMDSVRNTFGLRGEFTGRHCKGSGEDGQPYQAPASLQNRKKRNKATTQKTLADGPNATEETCPLLRDPVTAVRGFMAMVRRDAEAGWDMAPALKLARIASAFISFIHHYEVVPELAKEFAAAANLARTAVRCLLEAKSFEDVIGKGTNINRALWAVHGGRWKGPERGGLELEPVPEPVDIDEESGSDGGWKVEKMPDLRPAAPEFPVAQATLNEALRPLDLSRVKMLGYVPFSRRKVVAVTPPQSTASPHFMSSLHRVSTVAAPWTDEERWRRPVLADSDDEDDDAADGASDVDSFELEKEETTIAEPDIVDLWIEADQLTCDPQALVGMGLRGRWAKMGIKGESEFWTFKAKDFILPAFWQS